MQMSKIVRIANRNQLLGGREQAETDGIDLALVDQLQIELLGFLAVGMLGLAVDLFRNLEDHEQREREADARDRCDLLGEQVDYRGREQNRKRQREAERKVLAPRTEPFQIQGHPPQTMVLVLVA